jgi:hypothetical protein
MTNCVGEHVVEVPFDHSRIAKALHKEEVVSQTIADHLSGLISMDETASQSLLNVWFMRIFGADQNI